MIGINTDSDKDEYREKAKSHKLNWRDAWQGSPAGPIPMAWNISMFPSNFVLDAEGRIRHRNLHGKRLAKAVAELVEETKAKAGAEDATLR
jgi:hypothetical protein